MTTFRSTTATTSNSFFYVDDNNVGLVDNRRLKKMEEDILDLKRENVDLSSRVQRLSTELEQLKQDSLELLRARVLSFQLT